MVGPLLGDFVGPAVGPELGDALGDEVRCTVGLFDCTALGLKLGYSLSSPSSIGVVGSEVEPSLTVGSLLGKAVGLKLGYSLSSPGIKSNGDVGSATGNTSVFSVGMLVIG
jgi:H+/Cl- antiporter ClcA